jgi:hypothetical protein
MLPARKAMPAKTPSRKYAMRAQNQAIIVDENTVSNYMNRGYIDVGSCAVAVSRSWVE